MTQYVTGAAIRTLRKNILAGNEPMQCLVYTCRQNLKRRKQHAFRHLRLRKISQSRDGTNRAQRPTDTLP